MIVDVIRHYHPGWSPPEDTHVWNHCLCPFHNEDNPSAAVSYEHDAFNCLACGMKGDAVKLVQRMEGVPRGEARRRASELALGNYQSVSRKPARKRSRGIFDQSGSVARSDSKGRSGSGYGAFY